MILMLNPINVWEPQILGHIGSSLFSTLHHTAFIFVLLTQGFYIKIHVATEGCSILIVGLISIYGQEFWEN